MEIEILDPCDCRVDSALAAIIRPCLSHPAVFYKQGPYRKIRTEYQKSVMTKGSECYYFQTGLLNRVLDYCKKKNVKVDIIGEIEKIPPAKSPVLRDIVLRPEQLRLVSSAIEKQRGVLVAPTGIGKSLLGLAIVSAFPKSQLLWLCHTIDLMYQAADFARKHLPIKESDIGFVGDGHNEIRHLTFSTRQSFIKAVAEYGIDFDIIIVDEVHHLSSTSDSQYGEILRNMLAPIRIGLTATMPDKLESILAIEGLIGPIIDEVTIQEGQELAIMADIKIKFLKVPVDYRVKDLRKYNDVYEAGVVHNQSLNDLVAATAADHAEKGDSVLILVTRLDHGENILNACIKQSVKAFFAHGATEGEVRKEIKEALNEKKIHVVIATTIFSEGVNIPELNVLINAAGGKSEIRTLQSVGRGLRLTATKKLLTLYDILNLSHNYLISHVGERLAIYTEMGWL